MGGTHTHCNVLLCIVSSLCVGLHYDGTRLWYRKRLHEDRGGDTTPLSSFSRPFAILKYEGSLRRDHMALARARAHTPLRRSLAPRYRSIRFVAPAFCVTLPLLFVSFSIVWGETAIRKCGRPHDTALSRVCHNLSL